MKTHRLRYCLPFGACLAALLVEPGCSDLESCGDPGEIDLQVTRLPATDPGDGSVTISGTVQSSRRITSVSVADVPATNAGQNFETWTVEVPNSVLRSLREGGTAPLEVVATAICDETQTLSKSVPITALPDTPAPGLCVRLEPPAGTCSLSADGSALGTATVYADASAVGVPVTVSLPGGLAAQGLGTASRVILGVAPAAPADSAAAAPDETCAGGASQTFRVSVRADTAARAPASASVTVHAGAWVDNSQSLRVAAAPLFVGATGAVARGSEAAVTVSTVDRLRHCDVMSGLSGAASIRLISGTGLQLESLQNQSLPGRIVMEPGAAGNVCGQSLTFGARFNATAPVGTALLFECEDMHGQRATHALTAAATLTGPAIELDELAVALPPGTCSVPADGRNVAAVTISSTGAAEGSVVNVSVAPSGAAELLGAPGGQLTLLRRDSTDRSSAQFGLRALSGGSGFVTIALSATGTTRLSAPITIAPQPSFTGVPTAPIPLGGTQTIWLETRERIASCIATVIGTDPAGAVASVVGLSDSSFVGLPYAFPAPGVASCGAVHGLLVGFAADATAGAQLRVSCTDAHGQVGAVTLTAGS